jgi:hypothetical protein
MGLGQRENLFCREPPHHHPQFPTFVDARAHMSLQLNPGGNVFATYLAVLSILLFPVNSETGNLISVENILRAFYGYYHAV